MFTKLAIGLTAKFIQRLDRARSTSVPILAFLAAAFASPVNAGVIFVTSTEQKISATGGCSLQEAIAAANYDNNIAIRGYDSNNDPLFIQTQCFRKGDVNDPHDLIVLPVKATFLMSKIIDDAGDHVNPGNHMGPTATPMITSSITIDAKGSTLQFVPTDEPAHFHELHSETLPVLFRAFAIAENGYLELRSAYVRGFTVRGGSGGYISDAELGGFGENEDGGGGGMGAGGAIYVHGGTLVVRSSTFEGNGAVGGDGAAKPGRGGGGGGGLAGWGGPGSCTFGIPGNGQGGGGGGARGFGIGSCAGHGGGTLRDASNDPTNNVPGFDCGGRSGSPDGELDGEDGTCPGGGGGGGWTASNRDGGGDGGDGAYGGGGGGGSNGGGGGRGGFGGGGGAGWEGLILGHTGGDGGFGGGGGAGDGDDPGAGGRYDGGSFYGGNGGWTGGGGGGGLGGAIFNHEGSVVVQNSTFSGNYVARGNGGNHGNPGGGGNGGDAGSAIFTVNGSLVVQFTTIDGNEATGSDGGITVVQTSDSRQTTFALHNSIITNNGAAECRVRGNNVSISFLGNLIGDNVNCGVPLVPQPDDPPLGALLYNQGFTPTKALAAGSPAVNAADPSVFLGVDQRGQERTAGFADIGSFELCLTFLGEPCIILGGIQEIDFVKLTMRVSPEGTGTTTPAVGEHDVELNSVASLLATPNTSYRFVNWTGDVGDTASASTFIAMEEDETVTANFELFDFNFSAIEALVIPVGGSGSKTVTVNSMGVFNEAVSLSTSGLPSGAFASFNPNPATPPAGQSATSQMTVNLAPYAMPGSYNFDVAGNGGGRQHSRAVSLTIAATTAGVTSVINTLLGLGCIDSAGVSNAFTTKLAQAQAAINAGDTQTAVNILTALLRQLQAQAGKHLKTTCTANGQTFNPVTVLTTQVQSLLASLGATFKANPLMGNVLGTGGAEIKGAVVSLLNASKSVVATAETDATGFYFFAKTSGLVTNAGYSVKVTRLPKPYKKSTPATQTITWKGNTATFNPFVLN
jgi:hypothetical protein